MSYSRRSRYSLSPFPYDRYSRSASPRSRSVSRSRSRSRESSAENPGNNLYVTGLSARVTKRDLEKHFSTEGKVVDVHLVTDPWTKESRGFAFVAMSSLKEAESCVKYLDRTVLEGRVIAVEKAKRCRGRTPTPGRYLGLRKSRGRRHSPSYSPHSRRSSRYSSERERSYSPYYRRYRSYSRSRSPYSRSPVHRRSRYDSPSDRYYRRCGYRSVSRSYSPRGRSRSYSPRSRRSSRRSFSRSFSPRPRRRSYSRSYSPRPRRSSRRSPSRSYSPRPRRSSRKSYSRSPIKGRGDSPDSCSSTSYSSRSGGGSAPLRSSRSVSKPARSV